MIAEELKRIDWPDWLTQLIKNSVMLHLNLKTADTFSLWFVSIDIQHGDVVSRKYSFPSLSPSLHLQKKGAHRSYCRIFFSLSSVENTEGSCLRVSWVTHNWSSPESTVVPKRAGLIIETLRRSQSGGVPLSRKGQAGVFKTT